MARAPDQKYLNPNPGYRKGDEHTGGGGRAAGAGGKKRRPQDGWEKGDARRDVDDVHSAHRVPAKPGRKHDRHS